MGVVGKSSITYAGGNADTACLRLENTGGNNGYYHGIEFRTRRSGDVRLYAQDIGNNAADFVVADLCCSRRVKLPLGRSCALMRCAPNDGSSSLGATGSSSLEATGLAARSQWYSSRS